MQDEERAAVAARERTAGEFRLAAAAQARRLAEAMALQEVEARIKAETEALEAAEARSRAESAAALQARKGADALIRMAQAITLGARRALLVKRVALAGVALTATAWLGASWYTEYPAASPAGAMSSVASAPFTTGKEAPAADAGFTLNLKIAGALKNVPAER
jgi:hypothetical protein